MKTDKSKMLSHPTPSFPKQNKNKNNKETIQLVDDFQYLGTMLNHNENIDSKMKKKDKKKTITT